ncbi:hypothetical protein [Flavobacterium sp. B183]|uniref:hypothetical protein n=1 Tax=Flavobacterium sp. B183 TaxID=907046 RepID=UPI00201F073E|nr:hypothetical protein [Flavobacterium sp. B183]URC11760.1 hypothetical protein M4I44_16875 [Flavobacterium sp. B183]
MMKNTLIFLFFGLFVGCSPIKTNTYFSTCVLYGAPEVSLKLNLDKSFIYNFRYSDRAIIGKWKMNSDTLILTCDLWTESIDSLSPKIKTSDMYGVDKYLVKGSKLFIINRDGRSKNCYLKSTNR